ncbi:hypothetical protein [Corynebacterium sp. 209RC1]|uniref:hypothetical protein n=1 Tax=Corynebacterium sp. 209RC1 TaxID=2968467 RepID=UPI00211BDFEE|nr:hypothetical protein [Corynebacterium sp. 209RC1]
MSCSTAQGEQVRLRNVKRSDVPLSALIRGALGASELQIPTMMPVKMTELTFAP